MLSKLEAALRVATATAFLASSCSRPPSAKCDPPDKGTNPANNEPVDYGWIPWGKETGRIYEKDNATFIFTYTEKNDGKKGFSGVDGNGNLLKEWSLKDDSGGVTLAFPLGHQGPLFIYLCGGTSQGELFVDEQLIDTQISTPEPQG